MDNDVSSDDISVTRATNKSTEKSKFTQCRQDSSASRDLTDDNKEMCKERSDYSPESSSLRKKAPGYSKHSKRSPLHRY